MIKFSEFLNEARMAPLYHGTNLTNLLGIFRSDGLHPKTMQDVMKLRYPKEAKAKIKYGSSGSQSQNLYGVSLTRSLRFAKHWSDDGVIIEFDQNELNKRYKIVPFNFFQSFNIARMKGQVKDDLWNTKATDTNNEYEEFLMLNRDGIVPLKYVVQLHIKKSDEEFLLQLMNRTGNYTPYVTY